MQATPFTKLKIKGITDDVTTCENCGKTNLKRTVIIASDNLGERYFGADCAARAIGKSVKTINQLAIAAQQQKDRKIKFFIVVNETLNVIVGGHLYPKTFQTESEAQMRANKLIENGFKASIQAILE